MRHSDRNGRKADSANPRRNLFRNQEKTSSFVLSETGTELDEAETELEENIRLWNMV